MRYKKNFREAVSRLIDLYSGKGRHRIFARMNIPNPYLDRYAKKNTDGPVTKPDFTERAIFWDQVLSVYTDLEDDSIPSCYLSELDQGLYAGLLGAEIHYIRHAASGWISSMVKPFIDNIHDAENLAFDPDNPVYRDYIRQMEIFKKQAQDKFGISHFICLDGVNFLYELRGATQSYYDLMDYPRKVKKILDFSIGLCISIQEDYFKTVGLYQGGTVSNVGQWIPGKIVSESVDAFHLTSPAVFEEWGRGVVQNLFDRFDGGIIHLHTNGHHLLPSLRSMRGLKSIVFLDEDFAEPCYKKIDELHAGCKTVPMVISIPFSEFILRLDDKSLPGNTLYDVTDVPGLKTANEVMKKVRNSVDN
jgi:hypothetical protein